MIGFDFIILNICAFGLGMCVGGLIFAPKPVTIHEMKTTEMENMIHSLMWLSEGVSNMKKPESDNAYGRAATALRWCLPSDHPLWPRHLLEEI